MRTNRPYSTRLPALLLAAVLFAGLPMAGGEKALAQGGKPLSLAELKEQAPKRLQMEVTDPDGNVISVDAPVTLPDTDALPILLCKPVTFDTSGLRTRYPLEKGADRYMREADKYWNRVGSPFISYYVGEGKKLYGKGDVTTRAYLPLGQTPPQNDLTPAQIMSIVYARIGEFGGDASADLRIYTLAAQSGLYEMKLERVPQTDSGISHKVPVIDPNKPVKNGGKGVWDVTLTQYFRNVPVFPGNYRASGHLSTGFDPWPQPIVGYLYIMDEDTMNIGLSYLREEEVLAPEALLAPFSAVEESIRRRMESGQLKSVYRLSLGYSVALVQGDVERGPDGENTNARYVLLPVWQARGYDLKDGGGRLFEGGRIYPGGPLPDEEFILRNPELFPITYEVRFDAATGEPLESSEYPLAEKGL